MCRVCRVGPPIKGRYASKLGIAVPTPHPSPPIIPAPKQPSWGAFGCAECPLSRSSKTTLTFEVRSPKFRMERSWDRVYTEVCMRLSGPEELRQSLGLNSELRYDRYRLAKNGPNRSFGPTRPKSADPAPPRGGPWTELPDPTSWACAHMDRAHRGRFGVGEIRSGAAVTGADSVGTTPLLALRRG